ncbi:MAG: hypothetical protein V4510_13025 [bacterium]
MSWNPEAYEASLTRGFREAAEQYEAQVLSEDGPDGLAAVEAAYFEEHPDVKLYGGRYLLGQRPY